MSYKVVRNTNGDVVAFGPNDENYAPRVKDGEILSIEENTPTMPSAIPQSVTMAQARKALILSGVSITAVNAAIAAIVDPVERQLAETDWEYATTMRRQSPLVTSLAPVLGLTEAEIDDLFVLAATL